MEIRKLSADLEEQLKRAWEVRQQNFPALIHFVYPTQTTAITLTGTECQLDCAHCGGYYLEGMTSLSDYQLREGGSCLISGGCTAAGKVDILQHQSSLEQIAAQQKTNLHVGLVDKEELEEIAKLADVVSFDFIAEQETIEEVYGLERSVDDYVDSYINLKKYLRVLPHICIGIKGGKIGGEYRALELLKELGTEALVFIVLMPTKGTKYAVCEPPDLEEVLQILIKARIDFPQTPIHLGCMRPKGSYRAELDYYAIKAGINKLVMPTSWGVNRAGELGLEIKRGEECCVL